MADSYSDFDLLLAQAPLLPPWTTTGNYLPDLGLLEGLLTVPVTNGAVQASGRLAKGVDVWIAHELRRAGFDPDAVWPRADVPRVLPRSVTRLLGVLSPAEKAVVLNRIVQKNPFLTEARVLGEFKTKQVDVLMAGWDRGVELMVSTKTMLSSYGNNLANRYEEFIGEIRNLRGRFPLASIGLVWLVRSNVLAEPRALEYLIDVVRSLREMNGPTGYDAGAVIVADWDAPLVVQLQQKHVPADLQLDQFMVKLIEGVLSRTPLSDHLTARALCP